MKDLYSTIFTRKTIRKFDSALSLSPDELNDIEKLLDSIRPLDSSINVHFKIAKRDETTAKRGEYCLLFFSENKPGYLLNAGYMLEQIDLRLSQRHIGVCWYALAKPKENHVCEEGLEYIIMLAFGKSRPENFRSCEDDFKRKSTDFIWKGPVIDSVSNATRLAPSACNTQPWRYNCSDNIIDVFRATNIKSFIPASKLPYYNTIDMGIGLCFLEIAFEASKIDFKRVIQEEAHSENLVKVARYELIQTK